MPENIELPGASHNKTNQVERAVDTPADFTSPEELYKDLITAIKEIPSIYRSVRYREGIRDRKKGT